MRSLKETYFVSERAVNIKDLKAATSKVSLVVFAFKPDKRTLVLYNPAGFYQAWQEVKAGKTKVLDEEKFVLGFIDVRAISGCNQWTVQFVAAQKGYGPLVYDLAMSVIHPDFLAAHTPVSNTAKPMWNYMFTKSKGKYDIEPRKIEGGKGGRIATKCAPHAKTWLNRNDNVEDAKKKQLQVKQALDFKFRIKSPKNFSGLVRNHEAFQKLMVDEHGLSPKDFKNALDYGSARYFDTRYVG